MIRVFTGYDERESPGFHTFVSGLIRRASKPVAIHPLASMGLPEGSNTFTLSRFLVPWLCGFKGHAIFLDGADMVILDDIAKLDDLFDPTYAVQVVKHPDYEPQSLRKYIGTDMECEQSCYSRKNWMSCVIFNCEHSAWFGMTPQAVAMKTPMQLLQLQDFLDEEIGDLPPEWNVVIDEQQSDVQAKILHWSNGIPSFPHYRDASRSKTWFKEFEQVTHSRQEG